MFAQLEQADPQSISTLPGGGRTAPDPAARAGTVRLLQSFGVDLYGQLAGATGNVACSPYSVAVALAMTRNGARAAGTAFPVAQDSSCLATM